MLSRSLLTALFCITFLPVIAHAQNPCPNGAKSDKLACLVPQVYGANGIDTSFGQAGTFSANFLTDSLTPVQSSIARESALLPLASPSSGITFTWNPAAKAFTSSTDSFGPILGERAETIGKYRVFLGFDYQFFDFKKLDGMSLKSLPVVLPQPDDTTTFFKNGGTGPVCSATAPSTSNDPSSFLQCGYIRDVIKTVNNVDLKIHQFTTFITFGLTNRIDVSVAIPIENVRMGVTSNATIVHNDSPTRFFHAFAPRSDCPAFCLQQTFSNFGTASGIGDITLRVKGTAWKGERAALGLGVDVRVPTGQQLDFLGAGAAGVRPFVVWSYRSRISPHALTGYEVNGSSVVGGSLTTGTKDRLPSQLTYSVGADVWLTKWITGAFDIVGQQVFQAKSAAITTIQDVGQCQDSLSFKCDPNVTPLPTPNTYNVITQTTRTYNISNASVGVKIKPFSNLLITGNVLVKLNDGGLRSNFVPLVGLSYTF